MAVSDEPEDSLAAGLVVQAAQAASAAKQASAARESFQQLAQYLDAMQPILRALAEQETGPQRITVEGLHKELKTTAQFVSNVSSKSRLFLVATSRNLGQQIEDATHALGQRLSTVQGVADAAQLGLQMQQAELGPDPAEAAMVHRLEQAMREQREDPALLQQLCQLAGMPMEAAVLEPEVAELRKAWEEAKHSGDAETGEYLEYVIGLLEKMETAKGPVPSAKDQEYERRRQSFGVGLVPQAGALPAPAGYVCSLTNEVMEDPVQIESGETFERAAIEKWFADGNRTCPATKKPLQSLEITSNTALREAIDDWRKRNTVIQIQATRPKLSSGKEEEVEAGLLEIFKLCEERQLNRFWINAEGLIPNIVGVLKSSSRNLRRKALATLCNLATNNDENKEAIAEAGTIPLAVRALARDVGESRQGVALLLELSKSPAVCEEIGRAQGSILLLVTMLNSDNQNAAKDARAVLEQLASNDQNVVQMAEANHFRPLALRLSSGSDMTRIVMASALSRMALTDQSKAALAQEGAVDPLVAMIAMGKLEAKAAALGALQNLSTLTGNREVLIKANIIPPLLQLLFSVTSVVMSLKEGAAATLANIAMAGVDSELAMDPAGALLESEETIYQLLSLLNLAGPVIQAHLLRALLGMAKPRRAIEVRNRLRVGGAITVLMPFLEGTPDQAPGLRTSAAQLLRVLCSDGAGKEVADNLMDQGGAWLKALVKLLGDKDKHEDRAASAAVIAGLPSSDANLTKALVQAEALPLIVNMLGVRTATGPTRDGLLEGGAGALVRFTLPSNVKLQQTVAELGAIPLLVNVLVTGTSASKGSAAECLGNLAQSSNTLSVPAKAKAGGCCFTPPPPVTCPVHGGECDVKKSFCLLEADAVNPLVSAMSDKDPETAEAALAALSTLLSDQGRWENGVRVIHQNGGFSLIVQQLSTGTERAKANGVWMLEKLFRIDEYKFEYGAKAQGALVELTQHGSAECKPVAAKILSHLEILQHQSSYF